MASLSERAFSLSFPRGKAWQFQGNLAGFRDALAVGLERARVYIVGALREAIPGDAVDLLYDWHIALGLPWDERLSTSEKQARVAAAYTATGGSSLDYLHSIMWVEFPDVEITEVDLYNYDVSGGVTTVRDYVRLLNFIDRIMPLHLVPTYDIRITETLDTAYTGIAITGKAITGKVTPP